MKFSDRKNSFGAIAKEYQKYRGTYNKKLYLLLSGLIKAHKNSKNKILDLGCGTGISTEPLIKVKGVEVFGCDPDIRMLKEARKSATKRKLPIKYVLGSAEKIPFEQDTFTTITAGAAFHWFASVKSVKKICSFLKEKGVFFVYWKVSIKGENPTIGKEIYKKWKWHGIPEKLRSPENVKVIFQKAGLKKIGTVRIPFVEKRTIEDSVGLIKTSSEYSLLSPTNRKLFVKELTLAHKKILGSKKIVTMKREVCVCYGFK